MDILLSAQAIAPIFGIILIGYFIKYIKLISENDAKRLNLLCFNLFLPALCFNSTYKNTADMGVHTKLIAFITVTFCVLTILTFLVVPRFEPDKYRKGVDVQGIYRSNALLMGLPMAINLYGTGGALPTVLATGIILPFQNFFAVAALTHFVSEGSNLVQHLTKTAAGICRNPLIIAIALGMIFANLQIALPSVIDDMIGDLSGVATTLALISLGATFTFSRMRDNITHLFWISLGKLVIYPAAAILPAIGLGFTGPELVAVIAVFATPCGVTGYSMAVSTENDGELAGQLVVVTSLAAIVTLMIILTLCQVAGKI